MSALKDLYNEKFYKEISKTFTQHIPHFDQRAFMKQVLAPPFAEMELKERTAHTAHTLHTFLPHDFKKAAPMVVAISNTLRQYGPGRFEHIFLPEYLALYGSAHPEVAVKAMEEVTQLISCEFAIRPFIIAQPGALLKIMQRWTKHPSRHVRRLASEGSRPRLPWGMALVFLKKDPSPTLPILEALKNDSCEIVRRSVANHLNDISKDHPDVLLSLASQWKGQSKEVDAILKHACRTLLKAGNIKALKVFGLAPDTSIELSAFKLLTPMVMQGQSLEFSFAIHNTSTKRKVVRLEYAMYYLRANGTHSKKVFKISERDYAPGEKAVIQRAQSFRPITTRVYYKGIQKVAVIVNGVESSGQEFVLK